MSSVSATEPREGLFRGLCCVCGAVRYVSQRCPRLRGEDREDGMRCVVALKCAECGVKTSHAYLRDFDQHCDTAELSMRHDVEPYNPYLDALGRRWTWVVTELDGGCDEQICPAKHIIYLSPASAADPELALAHSLAHVELHPLDAAGFSSEQERQAEDLALVRLDRLDPPDWLSSTQDGE